ncbi:type IV pilin protein [Sporosarcina soli]|uniref:Type IV pilin protein n=1 Tax=Sporosarcina soli TaxID=334736 RepID=A0ABW0TS04_9BACL
MKKWLQKRLKNEKGLTLVELLAVIVILGIIAAIAVPSIGNIVTNSKVNALKADGQSVLAAASLYFIENNTEATVTQATLISEGFLEDAGGFATTGATSATVAKGKNGAGNMISGTAVNGTDTKVKFLNATNANITDADVKTGNGTIVEITR